MGLIIETHDGVLLRGASIERVSVVAGVGAPEAGPGSYAIVVLARSGTEILFIGDRGACEDRMGPLGRHLTTDVEQVVSFRAGRGLGALAPKAQVDHLDQEPVGT